MATKGAKKSRKKETGGRKGKPMTVYFRDEQANQLKKIAQDRHVHKSEIVRLAVTRFLTDLDSGQLDLPFGIVK